jgi:antitoxin Phd
MPLSQAYYYHTEAMPLANIWNVRDAKEHLGEVVEKAISEGPQIITVRGRAEVVVLTSDEYERLCSTERDVVKSPA